MNGWSGKAEFVSSWSCVRDHCMLPCCKDEKAVQYMKFKAVWADKTQEEKYQQTIFLFGLCISSISFQHLRDDPDAIFGWEISYTDWCGEAFYFEAVYLLFLLMSTTGYSQKMFVKFTLCLAKCSCSDTAFSTFLEDGCLQTWSVWGVIMSLRKSIFSICRKSAQAWIVLPMGPKWQDYILEVKLARWECGSPSTESKHKTQTIFKGQWEETQSTLRRAGEMHLISYKLYTVPHDPDLRTYLSWKDL